jgi:hypothetical protein
MKFSDEVLIAYVDHECDAATRLAIEAACREDSELSARIAVHRAIADTLQRTYRQALDEPVPAHLIALAQRVGEAPATVVDLASARERRQSSKRPAIAWPWLGGIAASLVVGLMVGRMVQAPESATLIKSQGNALVAQGVLDQSLSRQLGSAEPANADVHIAVSFRAKTGEFCRAFTTRGDHALSGVACRSGEAWQMRMIAADTPDVPPATYRQAATALSPSVLQKVDDLITGDALDAAAEAAAAAKGWR